MKTLHLPKKIRITLFIIALLIFSIGGFYFFGTTLGNVLLLMGVAILNVILYSYNKIQAIILSILFILCIIGVLYHQLILK